MGVQFLIGLQQILTRLDLGIVAAAVLAALSSYLGSTIAYSFLIPTLPDVLKLTYARTSVQVLNSLFTNYFVMG